MNKRIENKARWFNRRTPPPWHVGRSVGVASLVTSLIAVAPGVLGAGDAGRLDQTRQVSEVDGQAKNQQTIGPGKVRLTLTRDGRWLNFTAVWSDGRSLFSTGGLSVFADGPDGRVVEVANTMTGEIRVSENATRIRKCYEGATGGFRAPSPLPDDDADGRVDEDRLDGVDNDGDGRVDEDFAAIGDEMITTCYFAPKIRGTEARLAFHQEAYAWSLPHIDGTIMLSLRIKNIGAEPLENIRLGALFDKEGPFYFSKWVLSLSDGPASALVCEDLYGANVGLVVFPRDGSIPAVWNGGYLEEPAETRQASAIVVKRLNDPTFEDPIGENVMRVGEAENQDSISSSGASVFKTNDIRVDGDALVYGISPKLGALAPSEELRVDLAVFAVAEKTELEAAVLNTFRTYAGDGAHRYLPPPVSMTPRVLWGSYRPMEKDDTGSTRVAVELEALGDDPVTPDEISHLSGVDPSTVSRVELGSGVEQLVLHGEAVRKSVKKNERIILKGRLENGEFFEAILRPGEGGGGTMASTEDADMFWKTAGRLEMDLLSSLPNPFRDATTIYYEVPALIEEEDGTRIETREALDISVKVYNVSGKLVSVLVEDVVGPGAYSTGWQAADEHGNAVASGVYYVRLQIGKKYLTERLIVLK